MKILGIEFGTWSLKAVEMETRFRKTEILDIHEIRMPLQSTDVTANYRQAVESLLARLPSHPEKIVASLPPSQTALRFFRIPVKQQKKVEQMYRFELEDSTPFKLEDSIVEHYVMRTKDGSLVVAGLSPKRHILNHLEWLKGVGLDVDWLTFEGMGNIDLYLSSEKPKPDGPVLLLDLGHSKTNLSVIHQDRLEAFRTLNWGGLNISQSIALALNRPLEEAESIKLSLPDLNSEAGESEPLTEDFQDALLATKQSLAMALGDISHSLVGYRTSSHSEIESILITGGTSRLKGLISVFGNHFSKPVELFHPLQHVETKQEQKDIDDVRFGEALGRAFVYTRKSTLLFNFRKQELAKGTSLTEISNVFKNPGIIRSVKYASLFLAILFLHVMIATPIATSEARTAQEELRKVLADTFQGLPSKMRLGLSQDPQQLKKFIEQKNREMEQKIKIASKSRVPVLSLIRGVSEAFPKDVRVDVNSLVLDDRNLLLEGVIYKGDINAVTDALKNITALNNVVLKQEAQRFTYQAEIKGR